MLGNSYNKKASINWDSSRFESCLAFNIKNYDFKDNNNEKDNHSEQR